MGIRGRKSMGNLQLLVRFLGVFAAVALLGCPNPSHILRFDGRSRETKKLEIAIGDRTFQLRVRGFSGSPYYMQSKYDLALNIECKYAEMSDLEFFPENIQVLFGHCLLEMDVRRPFVWPGYPVIDGKSYRTLINYTGNLHADGATVPGVEDQKIRIIFDRFVYFQGAAIPIDTVIAVDLKTDRGLACQR